MGRIRKYNTDEERKCASKENQKKWREEHPNYQAEWRKNNKEKIAEYQAEWKEKNPDYNTEYRQKNKEKIASKKAEYRQNNREKIAKYNAEYVVTPNGRAQMHVDNYTRIDKVYNRGECTLTAEWIVEHIFNQPCHYCGKTDWHELGCDRIDNALPHTPDNVVPCCSKCNIKRGSRTYDEFMRMIGKIA